MPGLSASAAQTPRVTGLRRSLGLSLVTLYGLGNILGAGIYVLIGEVVGVAGVWAPLAFLLAAVVASFSAFSYGELAARYPFSAGEAVYVQEAFYRPRISTLVGLLIAGAGVVSSATLVRGFIGYLEVFVSAPALAVIAVLVGVLGLAAAWGIRESVRLVALLTVIEAGGLLLIVLVAGDGIDDAVARMSATPPFSVAAASGVLLGAFLAFYAYIGFEDMVNVAEEVERPERNLPAGILAALVISTSLYALVVLASLGTSEPEALSSSSAPLALVFEQATGREPWVIGAIGALAVINGALVQLIMAARVVYGMSARGWLPVWLGMVHPRTRTPLPATVVVSVTIVALAAWFPLVALANGTSFLVLLIFALVNLALLQLKRRLPVAPGVRPVSVWMPRLGLASTLLLLALQLALDP